MVWMKVPYTNFHNLNQDWIIRRMQEFEDYMQNIVQISVIKYADPIQWRITGQYEQSTVVIDAESGIAYISVQPVPAGVAITNTNYWTPVFDMSQILAGIEADLQAETDARTAADTTLQENITAETTARTDADTALQGAIDTNADNIAAETTARETAVTALQEQIENVSLQGLQDARIKDHFRYYVDNRIGDDSNDGLTPETAFKTIDRFLKESDRYSEIRAFINAAGVYRVTSGNNAAGASIHISASVSGVTLDFISTEETNEPTWSVYVSHWNFEGLDASNKMQLQVHGTDNRAGVIYFDNCLVTLKYVDVKQLLRLYGGTLEAAGCSVNHVQIYDATYYFSAGTTVTNTAVNIVPLEFIRSNGAIIGSWYGTELEGPGSSNWCTVNAGSLLMGSIFIPDLQNQYAHSIGVLNGAIVTVTDARLTSAEGRSPINYAADNQWSIVTDKGIRSAYNTRYYGSALQYFNPSTHAWTNVPTA